MEKFIKVYVSKAEDNFVTSKKICVKATEF